VIYFLEAVGGDAVKVGQCRGDRELRTLLAELRPASPTPLRELGTLARVELDGLHEALKRHRLHDDWFKLSACRARIKDWLAGRGLPGDEDSAAGPGHYRKLEMTAKVEAVPAQAMAEILAEVRKVGGDLKKAAPELDCTWRTLYRWIDRIEQKGLPIRAELAKITSSGASAAAAPAAAAAPS
jgi:hypothetical protein